MRSLPVDPANQTGESPRSAAGPAPSGARTREPEAGAAGEAAPLEGSRSSRLLLITRALAEAVTPEQVFEAVVDQVARAVNASSAGLFSLDEESSTVHLIRQFGYGEASARALQNVALDAQRSFPALDTIRTAAPCWFDSQAELLKRYPHLASLVTPMRSYRVASVPIFFERQVRAALAFTFEDGAKTDAELQSFLLLVARYSSQALERLHLLDAERKSRQAAEAAALRAGVSSRVSRLLVGAEGDVHRALAAVAARICQECADFCGVVWNAAIAPRTPMSQLTGEAVNFEWLAAAHRDRELDVLLLPALRRTPLTDSASLERLLTSGAKSQLLTGPQLGALFEGVTHADPDSLPRLTSGSFWVAPFITRFGCGGALLLGLDSNSCVVDGEFVEDLAERITSAIESARLQHERRMYSARTELLYRLARAVIGAQSVDDVFEAALDTLDEALNAPRTAILTFDAQGVMRFRTSRGLSQTYRDAVEGHCPWPKTEREPEPIFVPDALSEPSLEQFNRLFVAEQIAALGFIPLVAGGQLIGKFMLYYARPRLILGHELAMAKAIANHVAAAVSRFDALRDLQETVRFNEIFTGILGHDLRNPLGAIITSAEVSLRRPEGAPLQTALTRIATSGTRMSRMIDQLLDFTRVRLGGGIPAERRQVDLVELLQQVIGELESVHPLKPIRFQHPDRCQGCWDPDRLAQVFSNLVANALQHGSEEHGVSVDVQARQDCVRVEVSNAGAIPSELLERLFEPMAVGVHRRYKPQGLGLGLFISQQLVRAHGGKLSVRTEDDQTVFTVELPLRDNPQSN